MAASSRSRPTMAVGAPPPRPRCRDLTGSTPRNPKATTGSVLPLRTSSRGALQSNNGSISRWVGESTSAVPGSAADCNRAAVFTVSPKAAYSTRRPDPIDPSATGPVLIPTRTPSFIEHAPPRRPPELQRDPSKCQCGARRALNIDPHTTIGARSDSVAARSSTWPRRSTTSAATGRTASRRRRPRPSEPHQARVRPGQGGEQHVIDPVFLVGIAEKPERPRQSTEAHHFGSWE